jgi:hypothetical protein
LNLPGKLFASPFTIGDLGIKNKPAKPKFTFKIVIL